MKIIFVFLFFSSPLIAMEQQKEFDFSSINEESFKHYKAIKKIQEIIDKCAEKEMWQDKTIKKISAIHSVHSSTKTKQGLLLKVVDNGLDSIYGPWGQVGLPKFKISHHPYYDLRSPTSLLKDSNIKFGHIEKGIFDNSPELYPVFEVDDIILPQAIKLCTDETKEKFDYTTVIKELALLADMEKRYQEEYKKNVTS